MFPFLWQALIYREFFSQGDMEKSLGQKPAEMMDRERARIPDLQIGFLDHIALPVYKSVNVLNFKLLGKGLGWKAMNSVNLFYIIL